MGNHAFAGNRVMRNAQRNLQFQVMAPRSCMAERQNVRQLRKMLDATNALMRQAEKAGDDLEFWSRCSLIAGFVADTSVGFLEVGAGLLEAIPSMDRVGHVAKAGSASVKSVRDAGNLHHGDINGAKFLHRMANNALSFVRTKGITQQFMLNKVKTELNVVGVAIGEKMASEFAKDTAMEHADLVTAATGGKVSSYFKAIKSLEGVVSAAMTYEAALNARFERRLKEQMSSSEFLQSQRLNNMRMMAMLNEKLGVALDQLNNCRSG